MLRGDRLATYYNYIGSKWVKSASGKTFTSYNPANGKTLGHFQRSNKQDVDAAIKSAAAALPKWSSYPAPKRGEILLRFAQLLRKEKERFGRLITTEMGKVLMEGLGDTQEAIDCAGYMAGEGRRLFGHTTPSELRNKFCMTIRRPIGVVGLICPWNFPIAIPAWKMMPALVCGNTVILKPATDTPLCAVEFVKLLEKAGVPPGVVNLVTGTGSEVGEPLIKDPRVRAISFTGSRSVGEFVVANAGIKKVGLELGGKNPLIIMEDADLELAVEGVIWGAFGTTGQRCTAASRVIIHKKVKDEFLHMLLPKVRRLRLGDGLNKNTHVGPLINQRAVEKTHKYIQIGINEGAKLECGGKIPKMNGSFYEPTVFSDVLPHMRIATEEIFGPVLSVITVNSLDEAITVANNVDYGLTSAIYTKDIRNAFIAIERIDAGLTYINSSTIGSEVHLPFGGVKHTGNGVREAGIHGIEEFSEVKTVYIDYSNKLQMAQIDEIE